MPPEPESPLAQAARRKRAAALARTRTVLGELDAAGSPITFQAVARSARVSRQWLYRQPEIRAEIESRRDARPPAGRVRVPVAERASPSSREERLQGLLDENRRLRGELSTLRQELALALGSSRRDGPHERVVRAPGD